MQIAKLRFFIEEIRKDSVLASFVTQWTVYTKQNERWLREDSQLVHDNSLSELLDNSLSKGRYWRPKSSHLAYFPIQQLSLVLEGKFSSPPRESTQKKTSTAIKRALKHSQDAFDANHDVLTGAPNRSAFENKLKDAIDESSIEGKGPSEFLTEAEVTTPSTLALLALDIDHFKQLNDAFGHLYGDVVLQVFVRRIESGFAKLEQKFSERLRLSLARLGGEKFGILVRGQLTYNDIKQIAEDIRSLIASDPLPSDQEWKEIKSVSAIDSLSLPHLADRRVTASIGIAVLPHTAMGRDSIALSSQLRSNADAALYRAKAGGRNTVRHYSDILDRHGRVLQHHSATGLVAIDIGRTVGVMVGQEFTVFHPDFAGDKPFLHDDGRTHKRLGNYPRHPCARLLVLDVQHEISFCKVLSTDLNSLIPAGSHLEIIPVGSIAHLIAPELKLDALGAPVLNSPEGLSKMIQDMSAANAPLEVAILALRDVDTLAKERGTAFVNTALANIYRVLREVFPIHKAIAQILPTQLAIVLADPDPSDLASRLSEALRTASDRCAGLATFCAGAYWPGSYLKPLQGDNSTLRAENSLEYARFAVAPEGPESETVRIFNPSIAFDVLIAWRKKKRNQEAIVDYFRLKELGVEYAEVENMAALAALSVGEKERSLAIEAASRANALNPRNPIFKANQAYIECVFGDRARAWQLFSEIPKGHVLTSVYLPKRAQALAAAYLTAPQSFSIELVRAIVAESLALDDSFISRSAREELQTFLDGLSTPT